MAFIVKGGNGVLNDGPDAIKARKCDAMERQGWSYLSPQTAGIHELWARLVEAARAERPLTAKKWLSGIAVTVQLPGGNGMHALGISSGSVLDQAIVNELCTFMTARSYWEGEVLIGAFVIEASRSRPSNAWFEWLERLHLFNGHTEQHRLEFTVRQMAKAGDWYRR